MITKQNIKEAAEKYANQSPLNCAGSFADGVQWALQTLEPMHNEAANQLEQLRYIVRIPGTGSYFDWRDINKEYNWVAVDYDGAAFKYEHAPKHGLNIWSNSFGRNDVHMRLSGGLTNWRELIFERPK
jgi:hypothetical protein